MFCSWAKSNESLNNGSDLKRSRSDNLFSGSNVSSCNFPNICVQITLGHTFEIRDERLGDAELNTRSASKVRDLWSVALPLGKGYLRSTKM